MSQERIVLELEKPAALVLFEFLSRYAEKDALSVDDQAEQRVLWNLQTELERLLPEVLDSKYSELLATARSKVRDRSA